MSMSVKKKVRMPDTLVKPALVSLSTAEHFIHQLASPAAFFVDDRIVEVNSAFIRLFGDSYQKTFWPSVKRKIEQVMNEALILRDRIGFEFQFNNGTYRGVVDPVRSSQSQAVIFFEDISQMAQSEKNNALLYRISLLLSSETRPSTLQEKLQIVIDQVLFELQIFDCSIMLFDKSDGRLGVTAWGKSDHRSSMNGTSRFSLDEGIAGYVAKTLKPVVVPNILEDSRFIQKESDNDALSLLCVPLIVDRQLTGVLSATRQLGMGFTDQEVQLFMIIASRLATLVRTSHEEEQRTLLQNFSQILSTSLHIFDRYEEIIPLLLHLFHVDTCVIFQTENHGGLRFVRSEDKLGLTPKQLALLSKISADPKFLRCMENRKWVILDKKNASAYARQLVNEGLIGSVILPMCLRDEVLGFIFLHNKLWQREFTEAELKLGESIAMQMTIAIEGALYHDQVLNEQKKLQQVQETLNDGLILYTADRRISMYNTAARRMFGFKRDVVGMAWEEVLKDGGEKYCRNLLIRHFDPEKFLDDAAQGKTSMGLGTVVGKRNRTIEITVAPVYDRQNQLSGVLSHFRDITPIHELQMKMATRLRQLTSLFKISSVTGFNVQQLVRRILDLTLKLVAAKACQLVLVDSQSHALYVVESSGNKQLLSEVNGALLLKVKRVMHAKKPLQTRMKDSAQNSLTQLLIVPILGHHDTCIGTLIVADDDRTMVYTKDDVHLISIVASRIAAKLDTAWLLNQIEEDREKLAAIIEQSVDGIFVTDADEHVQIWNTALERLTGLKEENVRGMRVRDIQQQHFKDMENHPNEGFSEIKFRHPDTDQIVWLGAAYAPIKNNDETTGYVCILRDISRQKELDQAKTEFVSTASHELRSPITAIVGYLSMLRRGDAGKLINPQQAFFVDKAYQNSKRMVGLIEDLLITTRMETGQMRYQHEPVDLLHAIENIVTDLKFKAEEKSITISINRSRQSEVLSDKDGINQIFTNLINNAIKYTPEHGKITIDFKPENDKAKERLTVAINDNGVGIDVVDQGKIFEKFTRIDNPLSVSAGGTGLGLYITKSTVEELGGSIWVESQKGKGSTFFVSLPVPPKHGKERKI